MVGARLTKLHLMLEGRGQAANDAQAANNDSQVNYLLIIRDYFLHLKIQRWNVLKRPSGIFADRI